MKMEKTPRYTQRERNMVLGFAARYKDIIENKRTDAESNRKKDEIWRQIAKEFNKQVYHQRSSKQLRQLYKNMKLLLKKDLCGEGKGNRSFMDLLNNLSQQESVAQYISEQMSPSGGAYNNNNNNNNNDGRHPKYEDEYDDSKAHPSMDTDVILIKSEEMSDNEHSQNGCNPDDMDDDDDDDASLSPKDIPEVCLEEGDDDEIFTNDSSRPIPQPQSLNQFNGQQFQPEITIQNVGGLRMANLKSLQQAPSNSALSITQTSGSGVNGNGNGNNNSNNNNSRQLSPEQQTQQQLLLSGLGLSAVQHNVATTADTSPIMPVLQRVGLYNRERDRENRENSNALNSLLLSLNASVAASGSNGGGGNGVSNGGGVYSHKSNSHSNRHNNHHHHNSNTNNNHHMSGSGSSSYHHNLSGPSSSSRSHNRNNEYLMTLAIEERQRKIELINAQIEYWKTLTKQLDANVGHNPIPSCPCHFPGRANGGLPAPQPSSGS